MQTIILALIIIAAPIVAALMERVSNAGLSERRHSHHDTYVAPASLTRALVVDMALMAGMSLLLGVFCAGGFFSADPLVVLAFFASFAAVMFVAWYVLSRYKVQLFDEEMIVTPFFGPDITVQYSDIEHMEWSGIRRGAGFRNLVIWIDGQPVTTLSGIIGLDQVLLRIDRFDVLAHRSTL
ncbi:hypothetical protein [Lancefieldella sp. Marseille-Q7238]|uniref:hypothetical protein n=1 Tax=Lancefieldella sp. Marseille-Q7238 TaxID=3022127 RepID=UPI0024A8EF55|nr:hypothetical protein [Lancefieldella sp. Marseille-Q7238]